MQDHYQNCSADSIEIGLGRIAYLKTALHIQPIRSKKYLKLLGGTLGDLNARNSLGNLPYSRVVETEAFSR
jgi:hypothetical protein